MNTLSSLVAVSLDAGQVASENDAVGGRLGRVISLTLLGLAMAYLLGMLLYQWRELRPTLSIRNIPSHLHERLKALALRERRSSGQQALVLIEEALEARERAERRHGAAFVG